MRTTTGLQIQQSTNYFTIVVAFVYWSDFIKCTKESHANQLQRVTRYAHMDTVIVLAILSYA